MNDLKADNSLEDINEDEKEKTSFQQNVDMLQAQPQYSKFINQNNYQEKPNSNETNKEQSNITMQLPEIYIELEDSEFPEENNYLKFLLFKLVPLEKLFVLLPGKIMRFFFQIGDFYFFLYYLILH